MADEGDTIERGLLLAIHRCNARAAALDAKAKTEADNPVWVNHQFSFAATEIRLLATDLRAMRERLLAEASEEG